MIKEIACGCWYEVGRYVEFNNSRVYNNLFIILDDFMRLKWYSKMVRKTEESSMNDMIGIFLMLYKQKLLLLEGKSNCALRR
jgi:hypothetical protein